MPTDLAALGGSAHQHLPGYLDLIKRLDECLGHLLDALVSLGLFDHTIVCYTSDHGCHFKTRNDEYKRSCHESSLRVPTVLHGGAFTGGGRVHELVSLIDLPPTLLDGTGIPVPSIMQGRSLLLLLRGEAVNWPSDLFVQISETQVGRAIRTKRWKYCVSAPTRDGNRDASSDEYVEESLFDLLADPYELHNVVGHTAYVGVAAVLRERLVQRMVAAGETVPIIHLAPTVQSSWQIQVSSSDAHT